MSYIPGINGSSCFYPAAVLCLLWIIHCRFSVKIVNMIMIKLQSSAYFRLIVRVLFFLFMQNTCTNDEKHFYKGILNGTIHVVAGGGGAGLSDFSSIVPVWSISRDFDYGFVKLTAFDHSNLLFEYKRSSNGKVYDSFRISRDYRDILACTVDSCPSKTLTF